MGHLMAINCPDAIRKFLSLYMKTTEIQELFDSFESIAIEYEGVEC